MTTLSVRSVACQALLEISQHGQSISALMPTLLPTLPAQDRGLLQELVYGVCRWHFWLNAVQAKLLQRPLKRNQQMAAHLINLGLYQLAFTRIPPHAAVHETVAAAEMLGFGGLRGLINGVLRNAQRSDLLAQPDDQASYPTWLVEKLRHYWPLHLQQILVQGNMHPPMSLRVNRQKCSRDAYLEALLAEGIKAQPCRFSEVGITLGSAVPVEQLPHFAAGWVSVQDEAAQLCTEVLLGTLAEMDALKAKTDAELRVLDACAAPGGKTCALLEAVPALQLVALDIDAQRVTRIQDNLQRLSLHCEVVIAAAEALEQWWDGQTFARILVDAPCSATGVIRRHPDIKLLRKNEDIAALAERQLALLQALWPTLAAGGTLVYATCSILPQENSRVIERFLRQTPDAQLKQIDAPWGEDTGFGRQLFPQQNGHDGFFYACLTKSA